MGDVITKITVPTLEHLYQMSKTSDINWKRCIARCPTPGEAKRMGRAVPIVQEWGRIKEGVMLGLLRQKFNDPELAGKLICTWPLELCEGASWPNLFWGVSLKTGEGQNKLGILLMQVRRELYWAGNVGR